jgi:hypothetical protein
MKHNKELEGCVFYFFDEYTIKNKRQKIHKIVKLDFWIQNELTNYQKVIKICDWRKYYYIYEHITKLKIAEMDEEDTNIHGKNIKDDDTILMEFEDRELIYLKNYLKTLSSSTKYILSIIHFYKHILNSISLLVGKKIVHNHNKGICIS